MATRTTYQIKNRQKNVTEESVTVGETGNPIYIEGDNATVAIHPTGGNAKVQFTISGPDLVAAGTARWLDWFKGVVTVSTADIPEGPVVAVRAVGGTGSAVIEVIR